MNIDDFSFVCYFTEKSDRTGGNCWKVILQLEENHSEAQQLGFNLQSTQMRSISFISILAEGMEISIQGKQKYTFVIINSLKTHIGKEETISHWSRFGLRTVFF